MKKKSGASDVNFSSFFFLSWFISAAKFVLLSEYLVGIGRNGGMTAQRRSVPSGECIALPSLSLGCCFSCHK